MLIPSPSSTPWNSPRYYIYLAQDSIILLQKIWSKMLVRVVDIERMFWAKRGRGIVEYKKSRPKAAFFVFGWGRGI
jgi:hypothetical protein